MFKIFDELKDGLKNIIQIEKDEEELEKDHLNISYNNFLLHYTDPRKAIKKDIDNIKKGKTSQYERDFIWLFFLGIIPFKNPDSWKKIISIEREKFATLRKKYITKDIENFIELKRITDTQKYDNYKEIISKEEFEILNLIKVDVDRTYQENEIFLLDIVKKRLITVLYIYAKENPNYGYKQGMGDICGVFLFALYKNYYVKKGFEKDEITSLYSLIHSNNIYLENDLYLMFNKFMNKGLAELFLYNTIKYKKSVLSSKSLEEKRKLSYDDIEKCDDCELKKRAYILFYHIFKRVDPEFYNLLIKDVYPELFLVKWYLCIFTREFNLQQVIYLWDLIIMYEFIEEKLLKEKRNTKYYNFMDFIALSMLINCKPDIIKIEDVNEVMSSIMHYPTDISIEKICKKAIEIYEKFYPEIKI
jgi:TBC1 domain family protein 5